MNPVGENESYPRSGPTPSEPPPPEPPPVVSPPPGSVTPTAPAARVRRTRAGSVWVGLSFGAVFLVVLLIFVVQNTTSVRLGFLGWHFALPAGVAILVAAVLGALVMAVAGGVRIIQLRQSFSRLARTRAADTTR
ncbi:DUF1049 domain-containing protein [Nocardia yunnanensis]|uniref:DUF1049 domain-containing protein n=1 Tax=Nocardia yunnanensis TaxID=2382165 RepID=A0A386ZIM4_9NOCA|nr:lipopolysaccharide assembly protein LapA domain-containing protein [Nocardia yunnanensis]AYF76984.1 DUF1049 domain-containing protein [Nocardia yunnanensis]